ncbi:MAG: hypothetical protein V2B18_00455 [Pseudomonadota bacterium]
MTSTMRNPDRPDGRSAHARTVPSPPRAAEGMGSEESGPDSLVSRSVAGRARFGACRLIRVAFMAWLAVVCCAFEGRSEPLEYDSWASFKAEGYYSKADGRVGFDQNIAGTGTQNDLTRDLGLDPDQMSWRVSLSGRPLEHHRLRVYGSIPEYYRGSKVLTRQIRTRNGVFEVGTHIESEFSRAAFGFGYDLDFLIGPQWYAGLNGDLLYHHAKIRIFGPQTGSENTMGISEMLPALGAHLETRLPWPLQALGRFRQLGAFARMSYGFTPNYLNYIDIRVGGSLSLQGLPSGTTFTAKVGYEHESFFHDQEHVSGRVMEIQRDGVFFSVAGAF